MKKTLTHFLTFAFIAVASIVNAQTTLISATVNNGGFESGATGWTIVNGTQTNKWFIGNTVNCAGTQSAYIGTAVGNNNYTVTATSVVHLYRNFTFPAGQSQITLSFDFRSGGENSFDGVKVYLVPTTTTPAAGTLLATGQVGNTWYNNVGACTNINITLPVTAAGTTQRLVFSWRNDGSIGTQPGARIDNVTIVTQTPPVPGCATMTTPANGATGVCNTGTTLNWTAPTTGGAPTGYKLYFGTNNFPTNIVNGTNIGNVLTYNPGPLLANTTYYWSIVPTNGAGDATGCSVFSFTTGSGCYMQTPGGNYSTCGGSYYDSGGPSANYSNNESSATTICPSTPGQLMSVSFTSFNLESCCDFLDIHNGNSTGAPLIGTYTGTSAPCNIVSTAANGCLTFDFSSDGSVVYSGWAATLSCVASAPPAPAGSVCATAASITLPFTATGESTVCYGNDYTNLSTGSCATLYESGEDHVYALTVTGPQCISIALTNASTSNIGYQVYSGCPGSAGTTCIGNNGGSNPLSGTVVLPAAGTYYIVVDTWASPNNCTYDIAVNTLGSGPANDLPCNATTLSLNTNLTGDNSCSGSVSEPAAAACFTGGTLHTVWYRVVCPASGQLRIRTTTGTLTNTQIALYSGTCGALTFVACNNDAPACGTSTYLNSEITATGLTAGASYWICVDGTNNLTGTFDIMAVDGSVGFPPAAGQDCSSPNPVCAQSISVGNPGYQAYGNVCDFPGGGTNCLSSGERGSAWYTIPINANGTLQFDIVPNDWPGSPSTISTDYDFAVWKIAGSGSTTCAGIAGGATPLRCNYSGLGVTGCYTTAGTSPPAYPGFGGAYEASIAVTNGDVYVLCVSNFSNSTSGFVLNFSATSPINYTAAGSSITWTGGTNTNWSLASNWGGCAIPTCGVDATVTPSATNQPNLPAGNYYVNNLTINAGATLTLQSGANLHICGNFTNYGSIMANANSTLTFDNAAVNQQITGSLVGSDKIGNLVITKTGGSVILNNNIDVGGNFTTSNATSIFNINGMYMRVAGNFTNATGSTTFTGVANSTVEFNGAGTQNYNQGTIGLGLNYILMNNTGGGVNLLSNMICGTSGIMTFTQGRVITNAFEVQVRNTATGGCTAGNTGSFVQGNLRRYIAAAATAYDFPVGHATKGYQRANITFTSATTIPQLLCRFDIWPSVPVGPNASECPTNTYDVLPALDNGYWTITASANPTSGNYNTTLYSTNYTNSGGAAGWTVMKAATGSGPWSLNGTCVGTSTAANTQRTGMNGFSAFAVAQSVSPLPVNLLDFTGTAEADFNHLSWTTASEINNDYFTLERSTDGVTFGEIGRIDGAGNSTQLLHYSFNDMTPAEGVNYYRLRQTDYNGHFSYSGIVTLEFHRGMMFVNNIRPNPTSGEVNFDFISPEETEIHFVITDMTGRVVADEYRVVKPGTNQLGALISDEGAGVYSLKVMEDRHGFISVSRIVKY